MHKIKEMLMNELYEYEEKAKKMPNGKISAGDLQTIHKLTDTVKNIDKIEMLESEDGYSEDTDFMGEGRMYGTSYARGRGRNAKRDSMGRYSRGGGYSRDDGKEYMMEQLEEMMEKAENPRQEEALHRCMKALERA